MDGRYEVTIAAQVHNPQLLLKAAAEIAEAEGFDPPDEIAEALRLLIDRDMPPIDCGFEIVSLTARTTVDDESLQAELVEALAWAEREAQRAGYEEGIAAERKRLIALAEGQW